MSQHSGREFLLRLDVNYADAHAFYHGHIHYVIVTSEEGVRIRLPKKYLQRLLTPAGIRGRYRLLLNADGQLQTIERLGD